MLMPKCSLMELTGRLKYSQFSWAKHFECFALSSVLCPCPEGFHHNAALHAGSGAYCLQAYIEDIGLGTKWNDYAVLYISKI